MFYQCHLPYTSPIDCSSMQICVLSLHNWEALALGQLRGAVSGDKVVTKAEQSGTR